MLIDTVEIEVIAGRGGDGVVSWRREKFVPHGGPDGGDGGWGGDVTLRTSHDVDTLSSFRFKKKFKAKDGERGAAKKMAGKGGQDLGLLVPVGTVVTSLESDLILADLTELDQVYRICKGGKGGLGNQHFASATHQRPTEFTHGLKGQSRKVRLELRILADVALVGEPNAGKSSILKAITGVEARIGDYAFSTTSPMLGVAKLGATTVTLVDLPGLLSGAHQGKGLGDTFLQHATRVKSMFHIVDATSNVAASEKTITEELRLYSPELEAKPRQLIINKIDLITPTELKALKKQFPKACFVSVLNNTGIAELKDLLVKSVS